MNASSETVTSPKVEIARWKRTRHWAVWLDGELLAVTVYKKGAEAVMRLALGRKG